MIQRHRDVSCVRIFLSLEDRRGERHGWFQRVCAAWLLALIAPFAMHASGPRWVAGVNTFDPAAKGLPVVWAGGQVVFYIDGGGLSSQVSQSQAVTMLSQAAAVWNNVSTAAVHISLGGTLGEDVNSSNVAANSGLGTGATLPSDVQPTATSRPLGVIEDMDGSVIDAIYGPGASDPSNCTQDGVMTQVDNLAANGKIAHALMILNGRCATSTAQITLMQYQMVRAFGRILGLDWSQVNDAMFAKAQTTSEGLQGWPMMHAYEWQCHGSTYSCMPNQLSLRLDDIAGLNRLYPVTSANIGSFSNKQITAQQTISIQGTIHFRHGQGMQGVNVLLTPLTSGYPDARYQVSAVSGVSFHANAGNPVEGQVDATGNQLNRFGTDDLTMEGFFDLSGVPLPPGVTMSDYQLSFEPVNTEYTGANAVGPYTSDQVRPSGTMPVLLLSQLAGGTALTEDVTIADSASETHTDDGTEAAPNVLPANGEWLARLTGYGHTGWYVFEAKANRVLTVEATSVDEAGSPTANKAGLMIGFWSAADPLGSLPQVASTRSFNGAQIGLTTLNGITSAPGLVRLAFSDMRGDGRPDYLYHARLLYADSVFPARLAAPGGPIVIRGTGFRAGVQVQVNGVAALVTSVVPTEITAVAPPANGKQGAVALTVSDPGTLGTTSILDGLSYDAFGTDQIGVMTAPSGSLSRGVPVPFTVRVMGADNLSAAANTVVQFALQQGGATMSCGSTCGVLTNGAGVATIMLTPTSTQATTVSASLASGASVVAEFSGSAAPAIGSVTPALYVAAGGLASWQPVAVVLSSGSAVAGAGVTWSTGSSAMSIQASSSTTNGNGEASTTIVAGPVGAGATATLQACETQASSLCTTFSVYGVPLNLPALTAVSGAGQTLAANAVPAAVVLQVTDGAGHAVAGATVNFYEVLRAWQAPCGTQGRCATPQTLATQTVTVTSDANGMVNLAPLTGNGQASLLQVNATVGLQGSLVFSIEQHP